MRYVLVDRFLELERGKRARACKCVTFGEPFLRDLPAYPSALVLEALLQTGGMLARLGTDFKRAGVLGKVSRATFPAEARAGDRIELTVDVLQERPDGTMCAGAATVGDRVVASAEFMIVFLPPELTPSPDAETVERRRLWLKALHVPAEEA